MAAPSKSDLQLRHPAGSNPSGSNPSGNKPGPLAHPGSSANALLPIAQPSIKSASTSVGLISNSVASASLSGSGASLPKLKLPKSGVATASAHHHLGRLSMAAASAAGASAIHRNSKLRVQAIPDVPLTTLQRWNLEQLDVHIKKLQAANQKIPQAVGLLAADMRRKEEKRLAKRLANRRSACTSRARKKALIEEMTKDNARLRREAMILSFLPDPVVAISMDGIISFCSMQIERVLNHRVEHLAGANIEDILVPSSRQSIRQMIQDLFTAEQRALSSVEDAASHQNAGGNDDSAQARGPHEVSAHSSEQSFPLLEVKVEAGKTSAEVGAGEDVSDSSGDPAPPKNGQNCGAKKTSSGSGTPTDVSSLTIKQSSFGRSDSGDEPSSKKAKSASNKEAEKPSFEEDAGDSLNKNVEMCKLNKYMKGGEMVCSLLKDDVMGATVTANNADAKLSSLIHRPSSMSGKEGRSSPTSDNQGPREGHVASDSPRNIQDTKIHKSNLSYSNYSSVSTKKKSSGNSSEDSGYRESGESPEDSNECPFDSSSSSSASSGRNKRKQRRRLRPLAPTCNVRLIRDDLSTIWCELTSSIRTRPRNDADIELAHSKGSDQKSGFNNNDAGAEEGEAVSAQPEEKELLLCFRPICEGEKVGEELRFAPKFSEREDMDGSDDDPTSASPDESKMASMNIATSSTLGAASSSESRTAMATAPLPSPDVEYQQPKQRPLKKRKFESTEDDDCANTKPTKRNSDIDEETQSDEKRAIESMMELAKCPP